MIKGRVKKELTSEMVLNRADEYSIYRYYLGQDFDFKKKFKSPFREKDDNPNLCFFVNSGKRIIFKDFANGYGGDCFTFVMKLLNINYYQALERIDKDMGLGLENEEDYTFNLKLSKRIPDLDCKENKLIQIIPRNFTNKDLLYWSEYHVTEKELTENSVYSVDRLYINKQPIPLSKDEIRFAYKYDDYLKIYSPYNKLYKWISNVPNWYISGWDDIKYKILMGTQDKKLIITKSKKDEIILKKFFKDVCSTQNESSQSISHDHMSVILRGYDPSSIYIAYDNDVTGIEITEYYIKNYKLNYLRLPEGMEGTNTKDWSDLIKLFGFNSVRDILRKRKLIS